MMNYRAELDELMDNHLIELHKRELSVRNQRIVAGLAVLFFVIHVCIGHCLSVA